MLANGTCFYRVSLFLLVFLVMSAVADESAKQTHIASSQLLPPLHADVTSAQFSTWQHTFINKREQLEQLLQDAGIDLGKASFLNGLINNHSPYLLRHSVNPVNWLGSYSDALATASQRQVPIFLSIGYSTCHWCHVMEKESFLDTEVATVLNQDFVAVKLDKEVDVTLDKLFSQKQQLIKGESGWPINAILTPEGGLFWTDAYVSKPELIKTLSRVNTLWNQQPKRIIQIAKNLEAQFNATASTNNIEWNNDLLLSRLDQISTQLDDVNGGLKGNIKFPNGALLQLLLYQYQFNPTRELEKQITQFLDGMLHSGLWDSVNGGFFRYAQSSNWQQPHYEKMLYNQALLIGVYAKASYLFNREEYATAVGQTVDFLDLWMHSEHGGYYSAIDADYQGKEGGYYLYSQAEINTLNDKWKTTYQWAPSADSGLFQPFTTALLNTNYNNEQRNPLRAIKALQIPPHIDKKVLTSWNALLVTGLLDAYIYLGETRYKNIALNVLHYLLEQHSSQSELSRAVINNSPFGKATLEDYAWFSKALFQAYRVTQIPEYRLKAMHFYDKGTDALLGNTETIDWLSDQEMISALSVLANVGIQLSSTSFEPKIEWQATLNTIKRQIMTSSGDYFSAYALLLAQQHGSFSPIQYFARGNGRATLTTNANGAVIQITMAPGWHINSNQPLDRSLFATKVATSDSTPLHVSYPNAVTRTLGFSTEPLSLFEGSFTISVAVNDRILDQKIALTVQACNEKLCLFPERLVFY